MAGRHGQKGCNGGAMAEIIAQVAKKERVSALSGRASEGVLRQYRYREIMHAVAILFRCAGSGWTG